MASNNKRSREETFLSTMTFASMHREDGGDCECDECDAVFARRNRGSPLQQQFVPDPILRAIQEHKRQKCVDGEMKRTQHRSLLKRSSSQNVSVWQWTLPPSAEPLIEYGTSHRLIWVRRLPKGRVIKSIGTGGIIGSDAEEKSRPLMDWTEGGLYFLPSNRGKAVGWVNSLKEEKGGDIESSPVVLSIAKVPPELLLEITESGKEEEGEDGTTQNWTDTVLSVCSDLTKVSSPDTGCTPIDSRREIVKAAMAGTGESGDTIA